MAKNEGIPKRISRVSCTTLVHIESTQKKSQRDRDTRRRSGFPTFIVPNFNSRVRVRAVYFGHLISCLIRKYILDPKSLQIFVSTQEVKV
jgi:hypothetical protein